MSESARISPEIVPPEQEADEERPTESVEHPAKVMRIGTMLKQLLDEVRHAPLDDAGRARLSEIYETSVKELSEGLSEDLREELARLALPFADTPSDAELRVAQAQLVGWLEGLFHGIQATLFAQQMAARNQLAEMRGRGLPRHAPGAPPPPAPPRRRPLPRRHLPVGGTRPTAGHGRPIGELLRLQVVHRSDRASTGR